MRLIASSMSCHQLFRCLCTFRDSFRLSGFRRSKVRHGQILSRHRPASNEVIPGSLFNFCDRLHLYQHRHAAYIFLAAHIFPVTCHKIFTSPFCRAQHPLPAYIFLIFLIAISHIFLFQKTLKIHVLAACKSFKFSCCNDLRSQSFRLAVASVGPA